MRSLGEPLILRYEHNNYFRGFVVRTKRAGRQYVRYFSDGVEGRATALRRARYYRDALVKRLPWPARVKRTHRLNRTGAIGVSRLKERARSGRWFVRYVAVWPVKRGRPKKASFCVALYGEAEARRRAVAARRKGLAQLLKVGTHD